MAGGVRNSTGKLLLAYFAGAFLCEQIRGDTLILYIQMLVLLLFLPTVISLTCESGSGPVFFVDRLSDRNNNCFTKCANEDCSGVLLYQEGCVAINMQNYFGHLDEKLFAKKHCIEGISSPTIAAYHNDSLILDNTRAIKKTKDKYECLALCTQETDFSCLSVMFYAETGECLLNSANSDSVTLKKDTEGFKVELIERRATVETSWCNSAFALAKNKKIVVHGDIELHNATDIRECMDFCIDCDLLVFSDIFQECFVVKTDKNGKTLNLNEEEYMVLNNLCINSSISCSQPMFISYKGVSKQMKEKCLESCLFTDKCNFAYNLAGKCKISDKPLSDLQLVLERRCLPVTDIAAGLLFEESDTCSPPAEAIKVSGISVDECLQLCLKHPTQSCTAVTFSKTLNECVLIEGNTAGLTRTDCRQFNINVILSGGQTDGQLASFMETSSPLKKKKHGIATKTIKNIKIKKIKQKKQKQHGTKKLDTHKLAELKKSSEVKLETICNYHEIVVRISSVFPISGEVFVRNQHDVCGVKMEKETHSQLNLDLTTEKCKIQKDGFKYSTVIIVRENELMSAPIITEMDKMFMISCDYGNGTVATAASHVINIKKHNYKELKVPGMIKTGNSVEMELRSKRQNGTPRPVQLGQLVELVFKSDRLNHTGYTVSNCTAFSPNGQEKLQLIEDGCPTTSSLSYIMHSAPRLTPHGFVLPFKVFKFKSSDQVEVKCSIRMCQNCEQPSCSENSMRKRRTLPGSVDPKTEEVMATMIIKEEQGAPVTMGYCIRNGPVFTIVAGFVFIIGVELIAVLYLTKRSKTLDLNK